MPKSRVGNVAFIVFQLAIFIFYAWLRIENADHIKEPRGFGDTGDYFHNAQLPVFSKEFWTDARAPITALFWKAAGSQPNNIFQLQLYFSIICWGMLAFVVAYSTRSFLIKFTAFTVTLAFALSRDIFMWDPFLGSESIALSLTALFLSAGLWLLMEWNIKKAALVIWFGLLMVFTRDTYAYLFLMSAVIIIPVFWFSEQRWRALGVGFAFIVIFLASSELAVLGLRPYRAILMNTSLRIYPSEIYTEYFRSHGMPVDDRLVKMARAPEPGQKFAVNIALTFDEDQQGFRDWALGPGRNEYMKFLWFYKSDTFQKVFNETPGQSFYPDLYYYTATGYRPIIKDQRIAEILYPARFGLVFFFGANLFAAFFAAFAWRDKKQLWLVPLLMILLSYPQSVLVWAADVNDIGRHSIGYNVMLRLGVWFLLFFIGDSLLADISSRFAIFKQTHLPSK